MLETLLTPEDIAKSLQVTTSTVREWLRAGTIRGARIGKHWRIHPEELRRLADRTLAATEKTGT